MTDQYFHDSMDMQAISFVGASVRHSETNWIPHNAYDGGTIAYLPSHGKWLSTDLKESEDELSFVIVAEKIFDNLIRANLGRELVVKALPSQNENILTKHLITVFARATDEYFEDGMENSISKIIDEYILQYHQFGIKVIEEVLHKENINPETHGEALRWIGRVNHESTHDLRRKLLEKYLTAEHHYMRDGALLGLSSMNDPASILALEHAINHEPIDELREDMEQLLDDLREL